MARVGKRAGRNFGFGRQLGYAGPQALKDLFGDGHRIVEGPGDKIGSSESPRKLTMSMVIASLEINLLAYCRRSCRASVHLHRRL
jgi:hypothetical protein